uniref:ribosomal protein S19 n=1 Tax=Apostasia shenzhenica TaxID=1088818 RepID=UPI0027A07150|nr:ribosomal protein S19 [Apostasia shenzhenica]WGF19829.1 ribosomal protein S19 [Apostasia shenzhenica]
MPRRSIWKGSFVDAFLLRMKKNRESLLSRKIWSRRSSISPEFVDCSVLIYNGKTPVRCRITEGKVGHKFGEFASTRRRRPERTNKGKGRKGKKEIYFFHMARKGNPISVRLDQNRSSDSSRFSEGDRESHRMGPCYYYYTIRLFLIFVPYEKEKVWENVADVRDGHDTTSSNARRPQEETRDQSMS